MGELDAQVEDLLRRLRPEEKVAILSGCGMWEAGGVPRLRLPRLRMSDGPHGMRGFSTSGDPGATLAPCEAALASTFDEALVEEVGALLGEESALRGCHVLLGPCLNMQRLPNFGRHFECFSEDPHLSGKIGAAYIRGVQRHVAACAKHFACNDRETGRHTLNSTIDERALHEIYLAPFEAAVVEAGVESVMCGYNRLNGHFCSESEWLLSDVLRKGWGFEGWTVSDWFGNRSTEAAVLAGLNVEMPGIEPRHYGGHLLDAVRQGAVSEALLEERCRPVLRTLLRRRNVAEPPLSAAAASASLGSRREELLRRAAESSFVLMKNEQEALPLDVDNLQSLAVVGPYASATTVQGGGSARVRPRACMSILDALRAALPASTRVLHSKGCRGDEPRPTNAEFEAMKAVAGCDAAGHPLSGARLQTRVVDAFLHLAATVSSKEWFRRFCMPILSCLGVRKPDPVLVAAQLARRQQRGRAPGAILLLALPAAGAVAAAATVAAGIPGSQVAIVVAGIAGAAALLTALRTVVGRATRCLQERLLQEACEAAASADAVIAVVGTDGYWESEGLDQPHMRLPGRQSELVERVIAAARGPVIVVLNVGSPKELPWAGDAAAIVLAHFGGEQLAPALAAALLGAGGAFSGRLANTWPRRMEDLPAVAAAIATDGADLGECPYTEGMQMGYRHFAGAEGMDPQPLFPFGHGLSYTSFAHAPVVAELRSLCKDAEGPTATATVKVRNAGSRPGAEVVQLYTRVEKSPRVLRAFARTGVLSPGEEAEVSFDLGPRALGGSFQPGVGWVAASAGTVVQLEVGKSSMDIQSTTTLTLR